MADIMTNTGPNTAATLTFPGRLTTDTAGLTTNTMITATGLISTIL